jgi:hypothetical protein
MALGPRVAHQEAADQVCKELWDREDMFLQSEPGLQAGYPKLLPRLNSMHILPVRAIVRLADLV